MRNVLILNQSVFKDLRQVMPWCILCGLQINLDQYLCWFNMYHGVILFTTLNSEKYSVLSLSLMIYFEALSKMIDILFLFQINKYTLLFFGKV